VNAEPRRPTEAEQEILAILWSRGPSTVREVHELLGARRGTGYTTVLKLMQIMAEKGLVARDESQRSHVYRTVASQRDVERDLVGDLADRVFGGSAAQLALRALSTRPVEPAELEALRELVARLRPAKAEKKGRAR
jgi:BlaI family transcriptional regulator, penicillinase repressor